MKKKKSSKELRKKRLKATYKRKRKMKKVYDGKISGPTLVAFLLDETGSMGVCKGATISGFNEYILTLKEAKNRVFFTLTKFNSVKTDVVYNCVDVKSVKDLTEESYVPAECTPLYDAIGMTIRQVEESPKSKGRNILVVIQSDGQENASKEYNRETIFSMIKRREEKGWTFVYLGANQDAYAVASSIGVRASNAANYSVGKTNTVFAATARATTNYAKDVKCGVAFDSFYSSAGIDVKNFVEDGDVNNPKNKQLNIKL